MRTNTPAQSRTSRENGRKSTGPRSAEGKARIAMNRLDHGLRAKRVLLENEDPELYRQETEKWAADLAPTTEAEVDLLLDIVDARWCRRRLELVEKGRLEAAVQAALSKTAEAQRMTRIEQATVAIRTMHEIFAAGSVAKNEHLTMLAGAVNTTLHLVAAVDEHEEAPLPGLDHLSRTWKELLANTVGDADPADIAKLGTMAGMVASHLVELKGAARAAMEARRAELVNEVVVGGDKESNRFRRYRDALDRRFREALAALDQLRKVPDRSGSYVPVVQVNLRARGVRAS